MLVDVGKGERKAEEHLHPSLNNTRQRSGVLAEHMVEDGNADVDVDVDADVDEYVSIPVPSLQLNWVKTVTSVASPFSQYSGFL